MRIAWASPVHQRSAIGRDGLQVCRALMARGHSVRIIATDIEPDIPDLETPFEVLPWRRASPDLLQRDFDILIASIGDNYLYHGGAFDLFGHIPTLGVFHDFYLYDLFSGWLWNDGRRLDAERGRLHDHEVIQTYGPGAGAHGLSARSGTLDLADIAAHLPMTEWVAKRCDGALAHSSFYLDRLKAGCPGPVSKAAMPVASRGTPPLSLHGGPRVKVLTVGVMNPNKCADQVIAAVAASPALSGVVDYHLVGPIEPSEAARLTAFAADLEYGGLTIQGPVEDHELERQLAAADIICCLRKPVLEGASGSAIEGLLAGRPLIVANAGFYADLPDDLVFKVSADIDLTALTEQLERLVQDEPLRRRIGAAARLWAEDRFNLDTYVLALERLMHETIEAQAVLGVGRRLGRELQALGLTNDDPVIESISECLAELLPTT